MKIPNITIQQLLEAGVHLGHKTLRWNPKMKKYIFGKRDSIHIMDLTQTLELTKVALEKIYSIVANNSLVSIFLLTGILGGFTTYSQFTFDLIELNTQSQLSTLGYFFSTVLLSIFGALIGVYIGSKMVN